MFKLEKVVIIGFLGSDLRIFSYNIIMPCSS